MTLTHDNPADDFGDADWSAFAYVAGELDEAELATWEARLAEGDVEACEAVARAVELVGVVAESGRVDAAVATVAEESYAAGGLRSVVVAAQSMFVSRSSNIHLPQRSWKPAQRPASPGIATITAPHRRVSDLSLIHI